jgi:hypothetical protein
MVSLQQIATAPRSVATGLLVLVNLLMSTFLFEVLFEDREVIGSILQSLDVCPVKANNTLFARHEVKSIIVSLARALATPASLLLAIFCTKEPIVWVIIDIL